MTVDQLLRDANPVPAVQPLSTRERNLMLHTIHERINADTLTSRKSLRGGRRFFLVPATWLAGVAVAGVVGMAVLAPADTPMAPAANAAELLNQAATNVPISTSQSALSSSPYIKVHKVGQVLASTGPTGWMVSTDRTEYVPLADTERTWIVEATANQVTQVYGSGTANKPRPETYVWATRPAGANEPGWARPNQAFLATLPLDPQLLRDRLYEHVAGHGFSDDAAAFTAISDLLKSGYAGDDLRACLYRVLALIPGVRIVAVDDPSLKGASVFTLDTGQDQRELVIAPASGELLAVRTKLIANMELVPAGTVIEQIRVTSAAVTGVPAELRAAVVGPCKPGPRPNGCYEQ